MKETKILFILLFKMIFSYWIVEEDITINASRMS